MKAAAPLVCFVTSGHVASTPRLVKEATALVEAGFRVHVVAGRHFPPADPLDAAIFAEARWTHSLVDWTSGPAALTRRLLRLLARRLVAALGRAPWALAARAHHAEAFRLADAAVRIPARLYHGHCLAALPAVVRAARRASAVPGFDLQDYHDDETELASTDPIERLVRRTLQSRLLGQCRVLTAAAPLIGGRIASEYGVRPVTLLNVFPRTEAPAAPVDPGPISSERPARFYWFSQTVGPGRGLEAIIEVMARMQTPVELHLRGLTTSEYAVQLGAVARRSGLPRPIQFLPPAPSAEMVRLAASADLGLSVEETRPLNRDLCLANKIFVYLLAGIPQLMSPTAAHCALAPELGRAALLGDLADATETARTLDAFLGNGHRVRTARRTAWERAQQRFCWDVEKTQYVALVEHALRIDRKAAL